MGNAPQITNDLVITDLQRDYIDLEARITALSSQISAIPLSTTPLINASAAVNQIRNGDFSHSVASWFQDTVAPNNVYECAWMYSHPITPGQAMSKTTSRSGAGTDYSLKEATNSIYDPNFSDWDWPTGSARFQGATDVSGFFPGNNVQPGYTYNMVGCFVKLNQYVTCNPNVRMFAGLYAHSTSKGAWDWIFGEFVITATVIGAVATPTSRDYMIHTITNRDFRVNSTVLTVANAPSDADFAGGARVVLQWKKVLNYGVLSYDIYRDTGGTFLKLFSVANGTTYIDNGSFLETAFAFPGADFDELVAYTSTDGGIIRDLPYIGDPLATDWATIPFSIKVPQNYDMGDTVFADGQWFRIGFSNLTGNLDIDVHDASIILHDKTLTTATSGQFTADQVGCSIDIFLASDLVFTTTIDSFTNANEVEMADSAPDTLDGLRLYIHEGAPKHAIYMDLLHIGFVQGATYAPNAEDISPDRGIPTITPNGTTQGSTGGGQPPNTGDGTPTCLFAEELVTMADGVRRAISEVTWGDHLDNGYGGSNRVVDIKDWAADVWLIATENGAEIRATPTKRIYVTKKKKLPLSALNEGDRILTKIDGKIVPSKIIAKHLLFPKAQVRQIGLRPTDVFLSGSRDAQIVTSNEKVILVGPPNN